MTQPFAIEFAQGLSATVYLKSTLTAGDLLELHQTVDGLPSTATVLRIQLTSDVADGMPYGLSEIVRHWRQTRRRPVHLILVPRTAPTTAASEECRRADPSASSLAATR